jgi:choline dehydrogenase
VNGVAGRYEQAYEYVVVGSGSAGSVLAHRLGRAGYSVGVVEAGSRGEPGLVADPLAYGRFRGTPCDWDYRSLPQAETGGRVHAFPRGKLWGGSASVNGMVYLRGARMDFEAWAREAGEEWGWEPALRAFEELERGEPGRRALEPEPLAAPSGWHEAFLAACAQRGFMARHTFDDGHLDGAGWTRLTLRSGRRRGAHEVFLLPALATPQVEMHGGCQVLRVLFDGQRARGVECWDGDRAVRFTAEREVILCCGALNSPHLLLLSGIGEPDELSRLGVKTVAAAPEVGANLSDHLVTGVVWAADQGVPAGPTAVVAFAPSAGHVTGSDLQLWLNRRRHSARSDVGDDSFTILCALVRPASRGTVRLADGDARRPPVIRTGYLTDKADLDALVQGVRLARELGGAESFRWAHPVEAEPGPGPAGDDELATFVRTSVSGQHHPMGTCRMGGDDRSVVDPRLRVRGVEGLRVADASVFPTPVATGPDATTQMLGWRAADLILQDAAGHH